MAKKLGLVMIVKNEERSLDKCLKSVRNLVDEIYITDTGSTDKTIEIAKKYNAHISHFEWINDFAAARNFSLAQSKCDWNLVLDADEYLVSGRRKDLLQFLEKENVLGYVTRNDYYKEEDGEMSVSRTFIPRILPKGINYRGAIHEQVDSDFIGISLPIIFDHDGYLQEGKGERNLKILLEQLEKDKENPYILYQVSKTLWLLKNYADAEVYFTQFYEKSKKIDANYRKAGVISYIYNLLELEKYDDGIALINAEKDKLSREPDFHFACGTFFMKTVLSDVNKYMSYLPEIEKSFLKCLEVGEPKDYEGATGCGSYKASYNLGVWYEVSGNIGKAKEYYSLSARSGYKKASERLSLIKK